MKNYCLIKNINNKPDKNGYGSVSYNFLIQQNFISCQEYINFLNTLGKKAIDLDIYNNDLSQVINYQNGIFIPDNIDIYSPITYITLKNLQQYCNWKNHRDINLINEYPYNIINNSLEGDYNYWIPTYNEYYKSAYYNPQINKYYLFPNTQNSSENNNIEQNQISPYGLINAGLKFYNILYDKESDQCLIAGGSYNRHPSNAKAGVQHYISKEYSSNYISARLCKKCPLYDLRIELYDTYGDGWKNNYLKITDSSNKALTDNLTLKDGYGPTKTNFQIDAFEKYIYIEYIASNEHSYENYYKVYLENNLVFESEQHDNPPSKIKLPINEK